MKIGLSSLLFIIFLILKLTGVIAWSWWLVTSPLWIAAIIWLIIILFMMYIYTKQ